MTPIQPIEIVLDKPRKLLINNMALYKTEADINRLRYAKPEDYASIDVLMVDAFNHLFRARGLLPMDLMLSMLVNGLIYEKGEKRLSLEEIAELIDNSESSRAELSGQVWAAYFNNAGKNLKFSDKIEDEEKKTESLQTGPLNGQSPE